MREDFDGLSKNGKENVCGSSSSQALFRGMLILCRRSTNVLFGPLGEDIKLLPQKTYVTAIRSSQEKQEPGSRLYSLG